jgi:hypothetical protein
MGDKEFLPTGVQLIEAGYGGRVADLSAAPVQGVVVAVVDTGDHNDRRNGLLKGLSIAYSQ